MASFAMKRITPILTHKIRSRSGAETQPQRISFSIITGLVALLLLGGVTFFYSHSSALTNNGAITSFGTPLTETFNTLAASGTNVAWTDNSTIAGWYASRTAYNAGTGSSNTGALYSLGTAAGDRALGSVASGSTNEIYFGVRFVNSTGGTITSLDISYVGEQWRNGGNTTPQKLDFQYQVVNAGGLVGITAGTWTDFNTLDFTGPIATATAGALDGNAAANRTSKAANLALTIGAGQEIWLRWMDINDAGNDHGLAIDDLSVTANGSLASNPSGVGTATPAAVAGGDATLLKVTVTPGLAPPSTGLAVTANLSTIGGSAPQPFYDDGSNGDVTAGDNIFSFQTTVGLLTPAGAKSLPVMITDAQSRTGNTNIALTVEPPLLAIHTIQGTGTTSAYAGTVVRTTGVVTALKNNGFFVQDPNPDANAQTSEGVFVFTGSPRPAAPVLGDAVQVRGTVVEFVSSTDLSSPTITEISNSPTITVLSSGNMLPAPVALSAADTLVNDINNLERYEFMRVSISSLTVVAPTNGFKSEANATSTSDGVFYGVITGIARPFREPGIQVPNPVPAPNPPNVPRFDANPECLRVDSDAQPGTAAINVTTGATVNNLVGVLDYGVRSYTVLPDAATPPTVTGNISATSVPVAGANEFTVASLNMERFYDNVNDTGGDAVLTATAYQNRLNKASLLIRNVMRSPDIIGIVEMENLAVLQAVATKVNADAVANGDPDPNYQAFLEEGNDVGLIDVGFLVKAARVTALNVTQEGLNTTYINPNDGQPDTLNDRPPLLLQAELQPANGAAYPVTVIVNHLRSLNDVEDPINGNRVRVKRRAQAEFLANLIQTRQANNPNEKIISVGDYNAFQFNDGLGDSIGTIKGSPAPADQVVLPSSDLVNPDLVDLGDFVSAEQHYSYSFEGNAQELDHVLITQNLLGRFTRLGYARANADFPEVYRSDASRPERLSDHDGVVAYFSFPQADVSLTKSASPTTPVTGAPLTYTLTVTNSQDDAANNVVVTDAVPASTTFQSITAPAGWTCIAPSVGGTGTISCSTATLASNATAVLTLVVNVPCATANGVFISNTASVSSSTLDPDTSNNTRTVTTMVSNPPPTITSLSVNKPSLWPPNHKLVDVTVNYNVVDNCGPVNCVLSVTSNEPENGTGDGDTSPDWIIVDAHHVQLRAERAGTGTGRIYTITVTCTDSAGNTSTQSVQVTVPHSKK